MIFSKDTIGGKISTFVVLLSILVLGLSLKSFPQSSPTVPILEAREETIKLEEAYSGNETHAQEVAHEKNSVIFVTEGTKREENSSATRMVTTINEVEETKEAEVEETTQEIEETTEAEVETKTEIEDDESEEEVEVSEPAEDEFEGEGISYTQAELDFMAAAICQEAGGESRYVKVRVANVMVNRVLADSFPDTIEGVLTQRGQYDLYSGRNFPDWATEEIKAECYEVARSVLSGEERPFPEKVVFQAEFRQGNGTYEHCDSVLGGRGYYFCY